LISALSEQSTSGTGNWCQVLPVSWWIDCRWTWAHSWQVFAFAVDGSWFINATQVCCDNFL